MTNQIPYSFTSGLPYSLGNTLPCTDSLPTTCLTCTFEMLDIVEIKTAEYGVAKVGRNLFERA